VPGGALRVGRTRPAGFFFLFRSVSILRRMAYTLGGEQPFLAWTLTVFTSSLLDCFARLALSEEPPTSLPATCEAWVSRAGRGMFDGLSMNWALAGWLRFLGVPRMVPVCDMMAVVSAASLAGQMDAVRGWASRSGVLCWQCVAERVEG
jgi:hypothetical protein